MKPHGRRRQYCEIGIVFWMGLALQGHRWEGLDAGGVEHKVGDVLNGVG